jgi:hypothetical protein
MALILLVTLKLCLRTRAWSWITFLVYGLSLALLPPFVAILSVLWPQRGVEGVADMAGVADSLFTK